MHNSTFIPQGCIFFFVQPFYVTDIHAVTIYFTHECLCSSACLSIPDFCSTIFAPSQNFFPVFQPASTVNPIMAMHTSKFRLTRSSLCRFVQKDPRLAPPSKFFYPPQTKSHRMETVSLPLQNPAYHMDHITDLLRILSPFLLLLGIYQKALSTLSMH